MAEPTLSLNYTAVLREIGDYLGYTRDETTWDATQLAAVAALFASGQRKFLDYANWSFLSPSATLNTVAADWDYNLADDFGGMEGGIFFAAGTVRDEILKTSVANILAMRAAADLTGAPEWYAVRPKAMDTTNGHRWELLMYPKPDAIYVLTYRYRVNPGALSGSLYPPGGMGMDEALVECCLAVAEQRKNREGGLHTQLAERELMKARARDAAFSAGELLGRNADNSLNRRRTDRRNLGLAQYNGSPS